jgi:hypothetical protein
MSIRTPPPEGTTTDVSREQLALYSEVEQASNIETLDIISGYSVILNRIVVTSSHIGPKP